MGKSMQKTVKEVPQSVKETQREEAQKKRLSFIQGMPAWKRNQLSQYLCDQFCRTFPLTKHMRVAAYWPLPQEADTRPLLMHLHKNEIPLGLPRAQKEAPLTFHHWAPDHPLYEGLFRVPEPAKGALLLDLQSFTHILVPLLAFDGAGQRLGYGQGHYDRTLAALAPPSTPPEDSAPVGQRPLLIGYALACQQVDKVCTEAHDHPLDAVITEKTSFIF